MNKRGPKVNYELVRKLAISGWEHQLENGNWPPTMRELAKVWNMSFGAARNRIAQMVSLGYIEAHPRGGKAHVYRFSAAIVSGAMFADNPAPTKKGTN